MGYREYRYSLTPLNSSTRVGVKSGIEKIYVNIRHPFSSMERSLTLK